VQTRLKDFAATVPPKMPDYAVGLYKQLLGVTLVASRAVVPLRDRRTRLVVLIANPSSQPEEVSVLCLADAQATPCSPSATSWQQTIEAQTAARFEVDLPAKAGERIDVPILVAGDAHRPEEASGVLTAYVERPPALPQAVPAPNHDTPLGGCDIATVVDHTDPRPTFTPPGVRMPDEQLYLTIQPCSPPLIAQALLIGDRTTVMALRPPWNTPIRIDGSGTVLQLPKRTGYAELQPIVLLYRDTGKTAWEGHAVDF
jgi:hypothetical protein